MFCSVVCQPLIGGGERAIRLEGWAFFPSSLTSRREVACLCTPAGLAMVCPGAKHKGNRKQGRPSFCLAREESGFVSAVMEVSKAGEERSAGGGQPRRGWREDRVDKAVSLGPGKAKKPLCAAPRDRGNQACNVAKKSRSQTINPFDAVYGAGLVRIATIKGSCIRPRLNRSMQRAIRKCASVCHSGNEAPRPRRAAKALEAPRPEVGARGRLPAPLVTFLWKGAWPVETRGDNEEILRPPGSRPLARRRLVFPEARMLIEEFWE
ncbi:hypothetical protein L345_06653, partial [Ophiophagus hannah]